MDVTVVLGRLYVTKVGRLLAMIIDTLYIIKESPPHRQVGRIR
jgi:hypothetical protein